MKKLLFASLAIVCLATTAIAQKPFRTVKDTVINTNADTSNVTISNVEGGLKGLQATVIKTSGTVAGRVILQGSIDNVAWVDVNTDTLTLSNTASQSKVWAITNASYMSYRVEFITSGTQVSYIIFSAVRRPED
jgi:hypothetical protein